MRHPLQSILFAVLLLAAFVSAARADQIPELIEALSDANVRFGASLALVKHGDKAVPALRAALTSDRSDVPVWSAFTLGEMGTTAEPAVDDLAKALTSSKPTLRAAAAQALGKIGPQAASATDALTAALADKDLQVQQHSAAALGQIGPAAKDASPKLISAMLHSPLRSPARQALLQIGAAATEPLLKSLDDDRLRFDAAFVLRKVDPARAKKAGLDQPAPADVPALRLVLFDPHRDANDHVSAATELAALKGAGVPVLIEALQNERTSRIAATAFGTAGAVAVPALVEILGHQDPQVRASAADALAAMGPTAGTAAPRLVELLKDEDRNVRYHVVRVLHTFGKKAAPAVNALTEIILNERESEATRQWAIKTLVVTLPDTKDAVVQALIEASGDKTNYGVKQLARQFVLKIDGEAAKAAGIK